MPSGVDLVKRSGVVASSVMFLLVVLTGAVAWRSPRPAPVFSDEFSGRSVDFRKWRSGYPWGCTNEASGELQCYARRALEVRDGILLITADRRDARRLPYRSGMITSYRSFSQTYGYFELRAKLPRGRGLWPTFWLLPEPAGAWPPEVDILEHRGSEPNTILMSQHYSNAAGRHRKHSRAWTGPDFTAGFHTFALSWSSRSITWYVDGVKRFRSNRDIPRRPMYVLLNVAVGGQWAGRPDAATRFPSAMEIDYIRVWKDPDIDPSR